MKVQRLRIRYGVSADARHLGQRDLVDAWQHACEQGEVPLAYSEGKRPSPHISIAAPLSQGVTSTCELLDLYLTDHLSPTDVLRRLSEHLPCGIKPLTAHEVGLNAASLQSQVRVAEYVVNASGADTGAIRKAIVGALSARTLPTEYKRENRVKTYDLRPLILHLRLEDGEGGPAVVMRLRAEPERSARADQVVALLGLPEDAAIERTALDTEEVPAVLLAYRRSGETGV
jgi:radical SAM-linked protein